MGNGADLLGPGEFRFDQPEKLTPTAITGAHNQLQGDGYRFTGWHGTSQPAAGSMVNGHVMPSTLTSPMWNGLYVTRATHAHR